MSRNKEIVTNVVTALTARTQFGQILRRVSQENERFVVDRRGQPQAVIMSIADYVNTFSPAPEWMKAIQAESRRRGFDKLSMRQIDTVIHAVRKREQRKSGASRSVK